MDTSPPPEHIALNTDAAIKQQQRKTGWGVIAQGENGVVKEVWAGGSNRQGDPAVEEALVIRTALVKARERGWKKMVVYSDCKGIIEKTKEQNMEDQFAGMVIADILKLSESFVSCSHCFISRESNGVAHHTAKFALNLRHEVSWSQSFPIWLTSLAKHDVGAVAPVL